MPKPAVIAEKRSTDQTRSVLFVELVLLNPNSCRIQFANDLLRYAHDLHCCISGAPAPRSPPCNDRAHQPGTLFAPPASTTQVATRGLRAGGHTDDRVPGPLSGPPPQCASPYSLTPLKPLLRPRLIDRHDPRAHQRHLAFRALRFRLAQRLNHAQVERDNHVLPVQPQLRQQAVVQRVL